MLPSYSGAPSWRRTFLCLLAALALPVWLALAPAAHAYTSGPTLTLSVGGTQDPSAEDSTPTTAGPVFLTVGADYAVVRGTLGNVSSVPATGEVLFNVISGPDAGEIAAATLVQPGGANTPIYADAVFPGTLSGADKIVGSYQSTYTSGSTSYKSGNSVTVNWDNAIAETAACSGCVLNGGVSVGAGQTYNLSSLGDQFTDQVDDPSIGTDGSDYGLSGSWGDGSSISGSTVKDLATSTTSTDVFGLSASHSYSTGGAQTVAWTVTDADTQTNTYSDSGTLYVWKGAGQDVGGLTDGQNSGPVVTAKIADTNPSSTLSEYSATIKWGDGNTSTGTISAVAGGFEVTGSNTYAVAGTPTIETDISGPNSGTQKVYSTATVADQDFAVTGDGTLAPSNTDNGFSGEVAQISDPNASAGAAEYTAVIHWGDNTTSTETSDNGGITSATCPNGVTGHACFSITGSHTYAAASAANTPYAISVTVTDSDSSNSHTDSTDTEVVGGDPVISLGSASALSSNTDQGFSGQVATFTDPNPNAAAGEYTATIDWNYPNDNTAVPATVTKVTCAQGVSGTCFKVTTSSTHTYSSTSGSPFDVHVNVIDNTNGQPNQSVDDTMTVTGDPAISASGVTSGQSHLSATTGTQFGPTTLASFTDPNTSASAGDYNATIHWGDGTTSSGSISGSNGTYYVSGSHTYSSTTPTTITVVITDADNSSNTQTVNDAIVVSNPPVTDALSAQPGSTIYATPGGHRPNTYTLATVTDSNLSDTTGSLTATINWGDGTTSGGTITGSNGNFTVTGSKIWGSVGNFTVTVTITRNANPSVDKATAQVPAHVSSTASTVRGTPIRHHR